MSSDMNLIREGYRKLAEILFKKYGGDIRIIEESDEFSKLFPPHINEEEKCFIQGLIMSELLKLKVKEKELLVTEKPK